ncbi:hypothetical protein [Vibrio sp. D431a]|uniref:hypothetical protein n=1 Tax=Vibrio sp. D431a TaxID=2837388 RepID=UPI0025537FB8|nr:hypothetical protein [Vibrio sp. D431a]MDK9789824.1 hypothetical protein [Vibrio sp. D431a]
MNPRIFKKLTQAAAAQIDRLGIMEGSERFLTTRDEESSPEVKGAYKWERKSLERCCGNLTSCPMLLRGTVGYGASTGYYEVEWSDSDALSCLYDYVTELFTNWDACKGTDYPENNCPKILMKSARHLINYAKSLPKETKTKAKVIKHEKEPN